MVLLSQVSRILNTRLSLFVVIHIYSTLMFISVTIFKKLIVIIHIYRTLILIIVTIFDTIMVIIMNIILSNLKFVPTFNRIIPFEG